MISIRPRCYRTDTKLNISWDLWLEPGVAVLGDERLTKDYGIGDNYAKSDEPGRCFIPREKHCNDDKQCRPGTLCVPWHGTHAPREYRCGNFYDNDDLLLDPDKIIPPELKPVVAKAESAGRGGDGSATRIVIRDE